MDWTSLTTVVGALMGSSVLTTWLQNRSNRQKIQADAAGAMVDAILRWQGTLTGRIEALEKEMENKDHQIYELKMQLSDREAEITLLKAKIAQLEKPYDTYNNSGV